MMMRLILILLISIFCCNAYSQKKMVEYSDNRDSWERLYGPGILSGDDKYIYYEYGSENPKIHWLVLKSLKDQFIKRIPNGTNGVFSDDSQHLIYQLPGDSLVDFDLLTKQSRVISNCTQFEVFNRGKNQILSYKNSDGDLIILDLTNMREFKLKYKELWTFVPAPGGTAIFVNTSEGLYYLDVLSGKQKLLSDAGETVENLKFDISGNRVYFLQKNGNKRAIIGYDITKDTKKQLVGDGNLVVQGFRIGHELSVNQSGTVIYFDKVRIVPQPDKDVLSDKVSVWNYKDKFIPPSRRDRNLWQKDFSLRTCIAFDGYDRTKLVELEDMENALYHPERVGNKYAIIRTRTNLADTSQHIKCRLITLLDGKVIDFLPENKFIRSVQLSPTEKYVVWMDTEYNTWLYEISTGTTSTLNYNSKNMFPLAWLKADSGFLTEGYTNEIWQVNVKNLFRPINLTGGNANAKNLRFAIATDLFGLPLEIERRILLTAKDTSSKDEGYCTVVPGLANSLQFCTMSPHRYTLFPKSGNSKLWRVSIESIDQYPNLYLTSDFKRFNKITNLNPHRDYNWVKGELHRFPMKNSILGEMIIYKPENFDPVKKYPVIFNYYQGECWKLNTYGAGAANGFDGSYYVSQGYIVCVVDILNNMPTQVTDQTVNSLESAANYLKKYSWVNSDKLGLFGHSFGGFETNLLIANSNMFTCAVSSAGISNLISLGGTTTFSGLETRTWVKDGQPKLRKTLWQDRDMYIKNSAIFRADHVTTPVLFLHGTVDINVPFSQSVEYFTALRQLMKPSWLLSYDGDDHGIPGLDVKIRVQQFFDHYLKDKPMPIWMSKGIPTRDQGLKSGLGYN